jgi:hydrogenase maturation factor
MKLPHGKVPIDILKEVVFKNLGFRRDEVVLGPSAGIDGAVIRVGDKSLIVAMDPITGALERIGWLAVNVNANDVATFGVEPAFMLSCILLPENSYRKTVETISAQMHKAAAELKIAIVGGHCEVTPGLTNPVVAGCVMGIVDGDNYVTAGGARSGDKLILTKSAGIEGTAILASDKEKLLAKEIDTKVLLDAKKFFRQMSVAKEAILAFKAGGVHAMHDPTEGGIIGGAIEMAEASNLGVEIFEKRIRVQPETAEICKFFKIDPLQLISSGALLIATEPKRADIIVKTLKEKDVHASIIGSFSGEPHSRTLVRSDKKTEELPKYVPDHLWLALSRE